MKKEILELINNTDSVFVDINGVIVSLGFYSDTKLNSDFKPVMEINIDDFNYNMFVKTCNKIINSILPVFNTIINISLKDNKLKYNILENALNNKPIIKVNGTLIDELYIYINISQRYSDISKEEDCSMEKINKSIINICNIILLASLSDISKKPINKYKSILEKLPVNYRFINGLNDKKIKIFESKINKILDTSFDFTNIDNVVEAYSKFVDFTYEYYSKKNNMKYYDNLVVVLITILSDVCNRVIVDTNTITTDIIVYEAFVDIRSVFKEIIELFINN